MCPSITNMLLLLTGRTPQPCPQQSRIKALTRLLLWNTEHVEKSAWKSERESGQRSHRKRMKERRHIQGGERWKQHVAADEVRRVGCAHRGLYDLVLSFTSPVYLYRCKKKKNNTFLKRQRQLWVNSFCEQMKYKQYVSDNKELHVNLLNDLFFSLFLLQLKPSESVPVITDKTISEDPLSTNRRLPL